MDAAVLSLCGRAERSCRAVIDSCAAEGLDVRHEKDIHASQIPYIVLLDRADEDLCRTILQISDAGSRRTLCVFVGALPSAKDCWSLLAAGASDTLTWAADARTARTVKERIQRWTEIDRIVNAPLVQANLVGRSAVWLSVLRQVVEIGRFTSDSVLITGESGTGKERIARLIHELDPNRRKGQLVLLDCTTIVPELSGSEFFGHERGAFTGAIATREGAFELADGGTLFLVEVGELPLPLQAELLRVIQEGTYKRVGSNAWRKTDFRLVCATNRNLGEERLRGAFRTDLFYRLATWTVRLPTLKERGSEDIMMLADHFVKELCTGADTPTLDPVVQSYLASQDYPGNVRDLQQAVQRIVHRHVGPGPITIGAIPKADQDKVGPLKKHEAERFVYFIRELLRQRKGLREICEMAKDAAYRVALEEKNGSVEAAANLVRMSKRSVEIYKKNTAQS